MTTYKHTMDVMALPPRKIAAHLREEHGMEPREVMKGYERSVWSWQHECAHKNQTHLSAGEEATGHEVVVEKVEI